MDLEVPLPDRLTLKALIKKAFNLEPFTTAEYALIVQVLTAVERDPSRRLKERMREYAAEEDAKGTPDAEG